jgi:hypothetical protein
LTYALAFKLQNHVGRQFEEGKIISLTKRGQEIERTDIYIFSPLLMMGNSPFLNYISNWELFACIS